MTPFATTRRPRARSAVAPDGSDVRVLLSLAGGGMAEFELAAGQVSAAVTHRTVEEIWYVLRGRGEMWRRQGAREEVVPLEAGVCLTIPLGAHFQFRARGRKALTVLAITMPPWPGADEAVVVAGPWTPSVPTASRVPARALAGDRIRSAGPNARGPHERRHGQRSDRVRRAGQLGTGGEGRRRDGRGRRRRRHR